MELHSREESGLDVGMRMHRERKAVSYGREVEELKKLWCPHLYRVTALQRNTNIHYLITFVAFRPK